MYKVITLNNVYSCLVDFFNFLYIQDRNFSSCKFNTNQVNKSTHIFSIHTKLWLNGPVIFNMIFTKVNMYSSLIGIG